MGLTVRKVSVRRWPVTVKQFEVNDQGEVTEAANTFVAHFRPFSEEEFEALIARAKAAHPAPDENLPTPILLRRNVLVFTGLMVGWGPEVRDENRQSVPFTPETLSALVTGPDGLAVSSGINKALFEIRYGVAPEKNVLTSPAPGHETAPGEAVATS